MALCRVCHNTSRFINESLGVCLNCIREHPASALVHAKQAHHLSRISFGLPPAPPKDPDGIICRICGNECRIAENGIGYCGVRKNVNGRLVGATAGQAKFSWYHDPLPTNCVGEWVCSGMWM